MRRSLVSDAFADGFDVLTFSRNVSMTIGRLEVCIYGLSSRNLSGTHQFRCMTGIRASLYNAITEADTATLVQFMEKFVSEACSEPSA